MGSCLLVQGGYSACDAVIFSAQPPRPRLLRVSWRENSPRPPNRRRPPRVAASRMPRPEMPPNRPANSWPMSRSPAWASAATAPDYLATIDLDPQSPSYSQIVHRLKMPKAGDELHHFGWNACSSCHGDAKHPRRYLVLPGLRSSRIQIADVADPRAPRMHKIIDSSAIIAQTNLTAPHTVHCLPTGQIMLSMLGDSQGNAPEGSCCWTTSSTSRVAGNIRRAKSASTTTSGISRATT